jgi:TolB-like protein
MNIRPYFAVLISFVLTASVTLAEDLDSGLAKLSDGLAAAVTKSGTKKISVVDFADLQGSTNELGRYIAEQVSVSLVNSAKEYSVIDRANLKRILDEHKLTASGLIDPENARQLGKFAGVDAIILGTITPFGDSIVVTAKVISTETTQVLGAAKISVVRSKDVTALMEVKQQTQPTSGGERKAETPAPQVSDKNRREFSGLRLHLEKIRTMGRTLVNVRFSLENPSGVERVVALTVNNAMAGALLISGNGGKFECRTNDAVGITCAVEDWARQHQERPESYTHLPPNSVSTFTLTFGNTFVAPELSNQTNPWTIQLAVLSGYGVNSGTYSTNVIVYDDLTLP